MNTSKPQKKRSNFYRRAAYALLALPSMAHAAVGEDAITDILTRAIDLLTSSPAKLLFVLCIVGVGYSTWHLGKLPKERAVVILIAAGIIFGAPNIARQLGLA